MDILHLVDRLEELVNSARQVPLTNNIMIDQDRLIDLIDQMRVSIPDEVKKAQKTLADRDKILAQAKEEAERTLMVAREERDKMLTRENITQAAQNKANEIIDQGKREADLIRGDADDYVVESLGELEAQLERLMQQTRNGIEHLKAKKGGGEPKS
jgi:F0F1-type ATP synthase membrane subunit b/b'